MTVVKPQMRIYVDTEGVPVQELAAICVNWDSFQIYSVYLDYAMCALPETQSCAFTRRHIHGLNLSFLCDRHSSSSDLISNFYHWVDLLPNDFDYLFFANDPTMEKKLFPHLQFFDVRLPPWVDRIHLRSHKLAQDAKKNSVSFLNKHCSASAVHSAYKPLHCSTHTVSPSQRAMLKSGHHCALYDAFECYLYQVFKRLSC